MTEIDYDQSDFELLKSEFLYKGFFTLCRYHLRYRRFSGDWSAEIQREVLERPRVVAVLMVDPLLKKVVMIEQFRPGAIREKHQTPWLKEMVAGVVEHGESLESVARREAKEEAGCDITQLVPICDYFTSPGGTTEYLHLFYAQVDASQVGGVFGVLEEQEDIRVRAIDFEAVFCDLKNNILDNALTLIAIQWLQINQDNLPSLDNL